MEQGLQKGCVLFPRLLNILFTAVLIVVLQRFIENTATLAELVHLKEPPTSMEPEPVMDYVRHALWGIMYAEMPVQFSRSPWSLGKIIEVIVGVCRAFALTVSAKKTETICMPPPRTLRTMMWAKTAR